MAINSNGISPPKLTGCPATGALTIVPSLCTLFLVLMKEIFQIRNIHKLLCASTQIFYLKLDLLQYKTHFVNSLFSNAFSPRRYQQRITINTRQMSYYVCKMIQLSFCFGLKHACNFKFGSGIDNLLCKYIQVGIVQGLKEILQPIS